MYKSFLTLLLLFWSYNSHADLREIQSPYIEGDTLYIKGPIGSHIYDFMAYGYEALKDVNKVSLNSYGGNHNWALEIARKIKDYGFTTMIEEGSVCASACVYLFGVGSERLLSQESWLGIHGARLSGGHVVTFHTLCSQESFEQELGQTHECEEFLVEMYETSMSATLEAFHLIESAGVNTSLREYYFSLEDDPHWFRFNNVLKKPDLVVRASEALEFGLGTSLIAP